jgi:dienelactone hydrolase
MPVFIWGNGACSADGTSAQNFLKQIASFGFLAISAGRPGQGGSSTVDWMREAVNWAANGGSSGYNIDPKRIMVGGYSCGGTEAYDFINDDRVASIGIFNSGLLSNYDSARTIRKPVLFALGGPSDIAYGNVGSLYPRLAEASPSSCN